MTTDRPSGELSGVHVDVVAARVGDNRGNDSSVSGNTAIAKTVRPIKVDDDPTSDVGATGRGPVAFGDTLAWWDSVGSNAQVFALTGDRIGDNADNCPSAYNPDQADGDLDGAGDGAALEAWRIAYLGRKGRLTLVLRRLGELSLEERRSVGGEANRLKQELEAALEAKRGELEQRRLAATVGAGQVDVTLPGRPKIK